MKTLRRFLQIIKEIIRNEYFQVAFLLCFLIFLFFGKDLFSGESIYLQIKKDPSPFFQFYPWDKFAREVFHSGYIPLWNPYGGLGSPFLANMQGTIFHPLKLLIYLLPFMIGLDVFLMARLFIAGFFTYLFCKSINIGKTGALLSAISFMFCGHFMRYLNMSIVNVEICIPILFWAINNVVDKRNVYSLLFGSGALCLSVIGGHPESTFYAFLLAGGWAILRLFFNNKTNITEKLKMRCCILAGTMILGCLLSVIQTLPFIQHLGRSWNYHPAGSWGIHLNIKYLIALLLPWFYGNSFNSLIDTYNLIPYSGIITVTLALFTLIKIESLNRYGVFFAGASIFFMGLAYGLPGFKLIDLLPVFNRLFYYFRSPVTPACFSITIMAGMGLNYLMKKRNSVRAFYWSLAIISIFIILISFFHLNGLFRPINSDYLKFQVGLAALLLSLLFVFFRWYSQKRIHSLLFGIMVIGLNISTLWIDNLGNKTLYKEETKEQLNASFIEYINKDTTLFRFHVFPPSLLPPQLGLLHSLSDIRLSDPLIEKNQMNLLNFINETSEIEFTSDFLSLPCSGPEQGKLASPILDLLNLKYFVSEYGFCSRQIIDEILVNARIISVNKEYFRLLRSGEMGCTKDVLNQHPPTFVEFPLRIPEGGAFLHLNPAINSLVWSPEKGDGASFALDLIDGKKETLIFYRYINPKVNELDRKRKRIKINLDPYRGEEVILRLVNEPGPQGNNVCDWAEWREIRLEEPDLVGKYELISEKYEKIYKNKEVFPRAFIVPEAKTVKEHEEILKTMDSGKFDLRKVVILEEEVPQLVSDNQMSAVISEEKITDYRATKVEIETQMYEEGFLVLSDVYYPGWKVYVNGREERIYRADYLLRAVHLSPGFHRVRFIFDPMSFKVGLWIMISTILCLGVYLAYSKE